MFCKFALAFLYLIGLFVLACATEYDPGLSPQDYLEAHNAVRSEVDVANLTWDKTIEACAAKRIELLLDDCKLERTTGPYGENLALFRGYAVGRKAVNYWLSEKENYDFNSDSCATGKLCGDYTQIVSQDTLRLGCASGQCTGATHKGFSIFLCYYDPPGKVFGSCPHDQSTPTRKVGPKPVLQHQYTQPAPTHEAVPLKPASNSRPSCVSSPVRAPAPHFYFHAKHKVKIKLAVLMGLLVGTCLLGGFIWFLTSRWRKGYENDNVCASTANAFEIEIGLRMISYRELASATNNFGEEEKLGEGGFGAVYKGFLKNLNTFVAVKKISSHSKQGMKEYAAEVRIISRLRHRNTVKLIGWCHEKELMLVYEFMPNGSLDSHLFKGKSLLSWAVRYKIVQDVASALLYLHEEGDDCVLHRDIKSSNIMLDSDLNAKLGDFGLARLVDHAKGSQTTGFAGTLGYMAPECLTATSKASKKSDVYGFGVVALEIACGRRSVEYKYEEDQVSLVPWVWEAYGNRRHLETADKKLCMNFDIEQMECLMIVGLWCTHPDRNLRPCIRQVMQVLNFELSLPNLPPKMPIAKYDVPTALPITSSCEYFLSLTVPR